MLAKKYKLPLQHFAGQSGAVSRSPYFTVRQFPAGVSHSRFGAVVSKKVSGKAVSRNRLKRLIYDSAAQWLSQLPVRDYVIIASPRVAPLSREEVSRQLRQCLPSSN